MRELRTASGIDTVMMSVERQLPRKMRIMNAVSAAAISPSRTTAATDGLHEDRTGRRRRVSVDSGRERGLESPASRSLMPAMMSRVEAEPILRTDISTPLRAVELDDVGLRRRSVVDVGDVAHEDDGAVDHLDRHVVEVGDAPWANR